LGIITHTYIGTCRHSEISPQPYDFMQYLIQNYVFHMIQYLHDEERNFEPKGAVG